MKRPRILVVDDSEATRALLVRELSADYECLQATDGEEGLARALELRPDAVVSDLDMPNLSGLEMLERLRRDERSKAMPVVILTAVTSVSVMNRVRSFGGAAVELMPVQGDFLRAKLRTLLMTMNATASAA